MLRGYHGRGDEDTRSCYGERAKMGLQGSTHGILNPAEGKKHFQLTRVAPSEDLACFVDRYWIVRWDLRGRDPYPSETLPFPCVHVVFDRGVSGIRGISTKRFVRVIAEKGGVFGVKFRPGGFFGFLDRPMRSLTDAPPVPLREAFGPSADGLESRVLSEDDIGAQTTLIEAFLRPLAPAPDPLAAEAFRIAEVAREDREITKVEALSARAGLSPRSLQRLFHKYVGIGPKWVIRRYRIHEAVARAAEGESVPWASLALDLGFSDQAHLSREMKATTGRTPKELSALCRASLNHAASEAGSPSGSGAPRARAPSSRSAVSRPARR
jgi:AraC-like DNA-binding protein